MKRSVKVAAYAVTQDGIDMAEKLSLDVMATHPEEAERLRTSETPTLYLET